MGGCLYFFLFVNKARGWLENEYVGDFEPEVIYPPRKITSLFIL